MIDADCNYMEDGACGCGAGIPKEPVVPSPDLAKSRGDYKVRWAGAAISHQIKNGRALELAPAASRIPGKHLPNVSEES